MGLFNDTSLSAVGGAAKGAGLGSSLLPGIGTVAGGILGGAVGLLTAKHKAKMAKLQEGENQRENTMNQAWSGLLGQKEKLAQNIEAPSVLGGAAQGAMSGGMQAANIYQGLKESQLNDAFRKQLLAQNAPKV